MTDQRPSRSADRARRLEIARLAALSPRQRMILALELGERSRLVRGLLGPAVPASQ